ncbi:PAS domain-containing protein [bacterium]|nr:PAS domain-containing protein [bacterium]
MMPVRNRSSVLEHFRIRHEDAPMACRLHLQSRAVPCTWRVFSVPIRMRPRIRTPRRRPTRFATPPEPDNRRILPVLVQQCRGLPGVDLAICWRLRDQAPAQILASSGVGPRALTMFATAVGDAGEPRAVLGRLGIRDVMMIDLPGRSGHRTFLLVGTRRRRRLPPRCRALLPDLASLVAGRGTSRPARFPASTRSELVAVLGQTEDGVMVLDEAGHIVWANPSVRVFAQRSAAELATVPFTIMLDPEWSTETINDFRRVLREGAGRRRREVLARDPRGRRRTVEITARRVEWDGRPALLVVARDLAPQRRVERKLMAGSHELADLVMSQQGDLDRLQRLTLEQEKFAATGRMAARIAHEINNPLGGIKNSFQLLRDAVDPRHPFAGYAPRIEREIDRIATIVRQMYVLYRPGVDRPTRFALASCIDDVTGLLAQDPDIAIPIDVTVGDAAVVLPENQLRQVLYNLIKNAVRASPADGRVGVVAELEADALHLFVTDEGPGIPPEVRARIFEPFFTTAADGSGLGLGLSITRGIIEAAGGTLDFSDRPRRGTVCHVSLPLSPTAEEINHGVS